MKRKWFTLLVALMALASFQVNAVQTITSTWIMADTTGLTAPSYSANKTALANWLTWTGTTAAINSKTITTPIDDPASLFNVAAVGTNDRLINILSGTNKLSLSYGSNDWTQFEVVQFVTSPTTPATAFPGLVRATQALSPTMEGYLMPAQGGDATLQDTTASMLMVASNKDGKLQIVHFSDIFTNIPAGLAMFTSSPVIYTTYATYNNQPDMTPLAAVLNAALPAGQDPLVGGTPGTFGGYNRDVAYISQDFTGTFPAAINVNFADTTLITQYVGTEQSTAGALADVGHWTNGLPKNFPAVTTPTDPYGLSGSGQMFAVVVRQSAGGVLGTTVAGVAYKSDLRPVYIKLNGDVHSRCDCPEQFIFPQWMAQNQLISLPVQNQVWSLTAGLGAGFNKAAANVSKSGNEAVVSSGISNLTFTFVDSITGGSFTHGKNTMTGFGADLGVPLYYIQNDKGEYLTVDSSTYQFDRNNTKVDVTGTNLFWAKDTLKSDADPNKNKAALQLFAISGAQVGPNDEGWYAKCLSYVYLPLASYTVSYNTGKVNTDTIAYNFGLGKKATPDPATACVTTAPINDISAAFRIAQYSPVGSTQQNLIVANPSFTGGSSPVAAKWKKDTFDAFPGDCDYYLIKNITDPAKPFLYAAGGADLDSIKPVPTDLTTLSGQMLAHWQVVVKSATDKSYTFAPEPVTGYGDGLFTNTQLLGSDYRFKVNADKSITAFDFSTYTTNYQTTQSTLVFTCTDHTLPFYNPEWPNPAQLAIIEAPFVDRNLTDYVKNDDNTPTQIGKDSYQVYLNKIGKGIDDPTYLKAYKTNVRVLGDTTDGAENHMIPYFVFSLTKNNKEYFLNVHTGVNGVDSVYWTAQANTEAFLNRVVNEWEDYPNDYSRYKFCMPYQVDKDGKLVKPVPYGETEYQPVYIQTLDTAINDYPYLVVAGSATKYATAVNLDTAMLAAGKALLEVGNIYTVDYSKIDPYQVTSWVFDGGSNVSGANVWVPLTNTKGENPFTNPDSKALSTTGLLTNFKPNEQSGTTFITESGLTPNYGVFSGIKESSLFFNYESTQQIGTFAKVPIYYYRIGTSDKGPWLTDAKIKKATETSYQYQWPEPWPVGQVPYRVAYFDPNKLTYAATNDSLYAQIVGLRYVKVGNDANNTLTESDASVTDQTFVVISYVNYTNPQPAKYRYLAGVNNRLVFVEGLQNALVFQFGRATDGGFTGIEVVGAGQIFGVTGGVKLLNQVGNVVSIYTVDGRLVKTVQVTSADQTVDAPQGVLIVKSAGNATKVVVK